MDDYIGNKLEVGDTILVLINLGTNHMVFSEGVVTRFTPQMVVYTSTDKRRWSDTYKSMPSKVLLKPVKGELYG